jgi:uncharacterized phage protein gp47/JayE
MTLNLQNFTTLVQNAAAAVQGASTALLDLSVGSVLRAVLEASSSVALWLQWLILQVLSMTRAATSTGSDLDSWMADYGLTRLPAIAASGNVTFSRFTPSNAALIPVGAEVSTADSTESFSVIAVTTNPAWNAAQNGYAIAAGVAAVSVPVVALTLGTVGNVQPNTITLLATAIPGIDQVTNPLAFTGGTNAETDAAFRARFVNYINSRSLATPIAIGNAIAGIQQGLTYLLQENTDPAGDTVMGFFTVTINDGSGNPPASLISTVTATIEAVRPVGSRYAVLPPTPIAAAISLDVTLSPAGSLATVASEITTAITDFVATLAIGATLPISRLAQLAYDADPSVINVTSLSINGANADLVPPATGVITTASVVVN